MCVCGGEGLCVRVGERRRVCVREKDLGGEIECVCERERVKEC